jgi:hypothetical protein
MSAAGRPGEAFFAATLLGLGLAALAAALAIPGEGPASPGALPVAAAVVMVGAGAANLAQAWRRRAGVVAGRSPGLRWRTAAALALTATLAAALAPLGFLLAGVLFMTLTALALGARPLPAAVAALGVVATVWVVFRLLFEVTLPTGPIPEAAWLAGVGDLFPERP